MISMFFNKVKIWNDRFDLWSFISDFFFVIGVFVLNWNPITLILWFMIDVASMLFFGNILFYKESKDKILTVGFIAVSAIILAFLVGLYSGVVKFIDDLNLTDVVNTDPSQLINPIILPIILSFSTLNHAAAYYDELRRMEDGTYNSMFIKHIFIRYLSLNALILFMIGFFLYFEIGIVIGLILIKSLVRIFFKKSRNYI